MATMKYIHYYAVRTYLTWISEPTFSHIFFIITGHGYILKCRVTINLEAWQNILSGRYIKKIKLLYKPSETSEKNTELCKHSILSLQSAVIETAIAAASELQPA